MIYERRYVQFNDLVFDGVDMISDYDGDLSFKGSSTSYSFGHGSYRPFKMNYLFVDERNVSMTITLHMLKIPCEYRQYYNQYVLEELSKPGKLWCVKNGELLWALAAVESISEDYSNRQNILVYDVNFTIPGGVWHKADKQKTFLMPWNICSFMDCMGFETLQPCKGTTAEDCCAVCESQKESKVHDCSCCCEGQLTEGMALCYHLNDFESFYSCSSQYQIVYDCDHAEKFNKEDFLGQKICVQDLCDSSVIAGLFYSETDIPTEDVTVIISGTMENPWIEINGNTNIIKGSYDGNLIIHSNGDVYYQTDECCEPELLDPSVWVIPEGNSYGWTIYPRNNKLIIHLNTCCQSKRTCAYIQHDAITM